MNKAKIQKIIPQEDVDFVKSLVIYEDAYCIVLNKPSGLAVQGGSGIKRDLDSLLAVFNKNPKKKPKLVHRIDKETSGLILVAKNTTSAAFFSKEFHDKKAQKIYFAIIGGQIAQNGEINQPLKRGKINGIDMAIICNENDKDAQIAITKYENIAFKNGLSLVKLQPITGRMHQLRAHLAHLGHPIIGDNKYGGLLAHNGKIIPRLMLHAAKLEINSPDGPKCFETNIPDGMNDWVKI